MQDKKREKVDKEKRTAVNQKKRKIDYKVRIIMETLYYERGGWGKENTIIGNG